MLGFFSFPQDYDFLICYFTFLTTLLSRAIPSQILTLNYIPILKKEVGEKNLHLIDPIMQLWISLEGKRRRERVADDEMVGGHH